MVTLVFLLLMIPAKFACAICGLYLGWAIFFIKDHMNIT